MQGLLWEYERQLVYIGLMIKEAKHIAKKIRKNLQK